MALHLDAGRQWAPPSGYLGDLAVRVEQDVVHPVDHGVFDLQPEVGGVVRLAAENFPVADVGRYRADRADGFQDCLATGEWLIAERAIALACRNRACPGPTTRSWPRSRATTGTECPPTTWAKP